MKACTVCGIKKQQEEFCRRSDNPERLRSRCKACDAIARRGYYEKNADALRAKARRYRLENLERHNARVRGWRESNPDRVKSQQAEWQQKNADHVREQRKVAYLANRDKHGERMRAYYQARKDYFRAHNKEWRARNPDRARAITNRAKAIRRGASGSFSAADITRIAAAQKHKCAYCRRSVKKSFHIDHIVPVSKGGTNNPRNLQLLCAPCNQSKRDRLPEEYARKIGLLI